MTDYMYAGYDGEFHNYYSLFDEPEFKVQETLESYIYPIFLLFGSFGNICSILVMKHFSHSVWSTCLYLVILLTIDILRLYVECGNDWYLQIAEKDLSSNILMSSNAVCKVYTFIYNFLLHFSSWTVVSLSMELLIAVKYPQSSYKMCTRERARAVLLLLTVLLTSINLHFFWTYGLTLPSHEVETTQPLCNYVYELSDHFLDIIWPLVDFLIRDFIPLILVSIFTTMTIIALVRRGKQKETEMLLQKYFLDLMALQQLKTCVLTICLSFIIAALSRVTFTLIEYLTNRALIFDFSYPKSELLRTSINTIQYGYISLKFIIFVYACSKFRQTLKSFFFKLFRSCSKLCSPCSKRYRVSLTKTINRRTESRGPVILRNNHKCRASTNTCI